MTDFEFYQLLLQVGSLVVSAESLAVAIGALVFVALDHFNNNSR